MNTSAMIRWAALCALLAHTAGAWGAGTLVDIGVLTPGSGAAPESRILAISPDGQWAVGWSTGQNLAGTAPLQQAILWSAASGIVQIPNVNDRANHAHGVTYSNTGELVVAGYDLAPGPGEYRMAAYIVAPSANPADLQSGAWNVHSTNNALVGEYNAARSQTQLGGAPPIQLIAGRRGTGARGIAANVAGGFVADYATGDNVPPGTSTIANSLSAVPRSDISNLPVGAGYDNGNPEARRRALFLSGPNAGTQTVIPGGHGYLSESYGISPDTTADSGLIVGYDQDPANGFPHAFAWGVGDAAMTYLGELAGDNQSAAIDVRRIGGGSLIGGYSSDGTTEKAVLWDTTGIWDNSGQAMLLSTLLSDAGVDVSAWSSLSRVTSMSDDGLTVAGWGVWAADGTTRGFVATIPEPGALTLLMMGLPLLRRR